VDWFSREGAHALKLRIEEYWRERGYEVTVVLRDAGFHPAMRSARFDVRSDLVNGLPRRRCSPNCESAGAHIVTQREHAVSPGDLRRRACDLADTGRYNHWEEIGAALEADGVNSAGEKLGVDAVLRRMLNARCAISRSRKE
jgi:hypothetical protein